MTHPVIAAYDISSHMAGAPAFQILVFYDNASETASGWGRITQAINPPLDINVRLSGNFIFTLEDGAADQYFVFLKGVPLLKWPKDAGIGPVLPTLVDLVMTLNAGRTEGTANYAYKGDHGQWIEVNGVPVKATQVAPHALM